jgi:hypothetical protein
MKIDLSLPWAIVLTAVIIGMILCIINDTPSSRYSLATTAPGHAFRLDNKTGEIASCTVSGCQLVISSNQTWLTK